MEKQEYIQFSKNKSQGKKIKFKLPKEILGNLKRKYAISKLKNSNTFNPYEKGTEGILYMTETYKKKDLEVAKTVKNLYLPEASLEDNYTEYYYLYRKLNELKNQRKLIDYILRILNKAIISNLGLDEEDYILFNGVTINKLEMLIIDLKENKKSMAKIKDELSSAKNYK